MYTHVCIADPAPMRETPDPDSPLVSELSWAEPARLVTGVKPVDDQVLVYGAHYSLPGWVPQKLLEPADNGASGSGCDIADPGTWLAEVSAPYSKDVLDIARMFLERHTPYLWGGMTAAGGLDCSGLVHMSYRLAQGRLIPRDAIQQEHFGTPVPFEAMRPGDIISYSPVDPDEARIATHNAFWLGNGRILHSTGREDEHGEKLGVVEEPEPGYLKPMRRLAVRI